MDYSKYGFHDKEEYIYKSGRGLSRRVIEELSAMKGEPEWMRERRLRAYDIFLKKPVPTWGADLSDLNFDDIHYYVRADDKASKSWDDVPETIRNTFERLGIPEAERKFLAGVGAQYECLSGDAGVYTDRGVIAIQSVQPGDTVFSLDEETNRLIPSPVKATAYKGEREVFEIRVGRRILKATVNHPFLVLNYHRAEGHQRGRYSRSWKYLHELKAGDLVAVAKLLPDVGQAHTLVQPAIKTNVVGRNQSVEYPLDITGRYNQVTLPQQTSEDLMWWFGLYIGDGFIHHQRGADKARVEFAVPETDKGLREQLAEVTQRLFKLPSTNGDPNRMTVNSTIVARYLEANGFAGKAHDKQIPGWVASLPQSQILAFLGGYVDADGYVRDGTKNHDVVLTSGNRQLLQGVQELAALCGLPTAGPFQFESKHPYDKNRTIIGYRLQMAGDFERLGCRSQQRLSRLGKRKYHHDYSSAGGTTFRTHTNEFLGFARIDAITPAGVAPVYDIEVDGPHNFVAEGLIVHNSEVVYHNLQKVWEDKGVIFVDTDTAVRKYPDLVKQYFGTVIPAGDNKFAALNTAVWSGGSFIYVPEGVSVDIPLQAYFRINAKAVGQFERTLIIVEKGAFVHYVEGCFLAGAMVRTRTGEKPIEEIEKGDVVLTHKGRYREVYRTMKRPYRGTIYHIRYFGDSGRELHVTKEHPLQVVQRERVHNRNRKFVPQWLAAAQVRPGDYLAIPVPQVETLLETSRTISVPIGRGRHAPVIKRMTLPIEPDFCRLLGYYHAEGHVDQEHYLTFSFNASEADFLDDVRALIGRYFGKAPIENSPRLNGQSLVLCSTEVARVFAREFGSTVHDKSVPEYVRNAPMESLAEWVRGLWRGDGSYDERKNIFRFNTVSPVLAYAFRDALLKLGVAASINRQERQSPRQPMYTVVISSPWNSRFGEIVGRHAPNGQQSGSPFYLDGQYMYVPIRSIETEEVDSLVYNFSVLEDESYVCEGVVSHNCTAPIYDENSLHSAVVEIIVRPGGRARYTTIQNWSTNVYNLVTKRAVAYDEAKVEWIDGNIGCVTGDTAVLLNNNVKPIREIEPGDVVYSLDANVQLVKNPVVAKKYSGKQMVFRLQTMNFREIRATANHPFLALSRQGTQLSLVWKRLDQLTTSDLVAISGDLPDHGVERRFEPIPTRGIKPIILPESSTEDLLWLLGLYLGDGYLDKNRVYFAVPPRDAAHARLLNLLTSLFQVEYEIKGSVVRINSVQLRDWLLYLGLGGNAHEKRVPAWIYTVPKAQRLAFIEGYIAADGYKREGHSNMSITSVNRPLLEDVKSLAIACGLDPRKISRWTRREKKPLGKEEKEYTHYFLYFGDHRYEQPVYFSRVTTIEPLGIEDTWDIEIANSHNFVANGFIVHNSKITMKYPAIYLMGPGAKGETVSIAYAGQGQHQDAGAKMVHVAPYTTSTIVSKSISRGGGRTTYRGLAKVARGAHDSTVSVRCDALLLDELSRSDTIPYIEVDEERVSLAHEATVGKIGEDQLFYLMSRGIKEQEAMSMIVMGFIEPFTRELPMEYAVELNRLIQLEMAGSVG